MFIKRDGRWQAVASHASPLQALAGGPGAPVQRANPLAGDWTANIAKSKLAGSSQLRRATLHFAVTGDTVTATSDIVLASGKESHATETFQTDGKGHPFEQSPLGPGVVVTARWIDPRVLETVVTQNDREVSRARYEVSADGRTLVATTSGMIDQVLVFERR